MEYYDGMFDGKLARNVHFGVVHKRRQIIDQLHK